MCGHQVAVLARIQHDFQQMPRVEPEDRPAVGADVADFFELAVDGLRLLDGRRINEMMNLAGLVAFLVNRRDFDRQHKTRIAATTRRQPRRNRLVDVVPQAKQAGLGGNELVLDLGNPGRMREIPGAYDRDTFLASPVSKVLEITILAGRPGILGMNVEVGVKAHPHIICIVAQHGQRRPFR